MENRFDHTSPEEQQGWGAYATPPPVPGQLNSPRSLAGQASLCARVREMLPALLENDGEIRPEMASALFGHLATCPGCAREFDEMQRVVAMMEALGPAEMPADFSGLILQRIQTEMPNLYGAPARPSQAASSSATGKAANTQAEPEIAVRTLRPSQTQLVAQIQAAPVQKQTQAVATTTQTNLTQETVRQTGVRLWERLTLTGVLTGLLAFVLSTGWGRQMTSVNLETAGIWLGQIGDVLRRVPLLGWIASAVFAALASVGDLLDETYRSVGPTAMQGFLLDFALCAGAYYLLVVRRQRTTARGL